jgi:hypothetical protein
MSWEYNEYNKPCPCGKGLIHVVDGSNDWGQTSHRESILCVECKERDGKLRQVKDKRLKIANSKIGLVISYFKKNYSELLIEKFNNAKSKKAVWQKACEMGIENCGLNKFYKNYKDKEQYINNLISWYRFDSIYNALNIVDPKLSDLYQDAKAHIKEFEDESTSASYMHFKGR